MSVGVQPKRSPAARGMDEGVLRFRSLMAREPLGAFCTPISCGKCGTSCSSAPGSIVRQAVGNWWWRGAASLRDTVNVQPWMSWHR